MDQKPSACSMECLFSFWAPTTHIRQTAVLNASYVPSESLLPCQAVMSCRRVRRWSCLCYVLHRGSPLHCGAGAAWDSSLHLVLRGCRSTNAANDEDHTDTHSYGSSTNILHPQLVSRQACWPKCQHMVISITSCFRT